MFTKRYFNTILRAERDFGFEYDSEESIESVYCNAWNFILKHYKGELPETLIACDFDSTTTCDEDGFEYIGTFPDLRDEKVYYIDNPNYGKEGEPEYLFSRRTGWGPQEGERTLLGWEIDINGKVLGILSGRCNNPL